MFMFLTRKLFTSCIKVREKRFSELNGLTELFLAEVLSISWAAQEDAE